MNAIGRRENSTQMASPYEILISRTTDGPHSIPIRINTNTIQRPGSGYRLKPFPRPEAVSNGYHT